MDQTDIGGPSYPAARIVANRLQARIAAALDKMGDAPKPDARTIEEIITTAFWASLRREEGHAPRISIAFLPNRVSDPSNSILAFRSRQNYLPGLLPPWKSRESTSAYGSMMTGCMRGASLLPFRRGALSSKSSGRNCSS